jgi:hypothetical protein
MNEDRNDLHHDRPPTGRLDEAAPESHAHRQTGRGHADPGATRAAGLEPGPAKVTSVRDRAITGELDRAVNAPDHGETRDR